MCISILVYIFLVIIFSYLEINIDDFLFVTVCSTSISLRQL
jgi:hypothetical protein